MKYTRMVTIRLSEDEYNALYSKVEDSNYRNISAFIRDLIYKRNVKIVKGIKCRKELIAELHKIGINLNQIARYVNSIKSVDEQVLSELQNIKNLLKNIKGEK